MLRRAASAAARSSLAATPAALRHPLAVECSALARTIATGIPVGASPQLIVSAVAPHRQGVAMDIAGVIFEHGASIAATKKVMLEDHFAMLLSVYTPPDGTAPQTLAEELQSAAVAERLGFTISAKLTDATRKASVDAEAHEQRRLKLSCPQRPGIVLAITELLKDQDCRMSAISADTMAVGSEIWFEVRQPRRLLVCAGRQRASPLLTLGLARVRCHRSRRSSTCRPASTHRHSSHRFASGPSRKTRVAP